MSSVDDCILFGDELSCPRCGGGKIIKDGKTAGGKQRYRCGLCGRSFVINKSGVHPVVKDIADKLIINGVAVPLLVKVFKGYASRKWLYDRRAGLL